MIQLPSARKNFCDPPPEYGTNPLIVDVNVGRATPVPELDVIVEVPVVKPRLVGVPGGHAHVPSALR